MEEAGTLRTLEPTGPIVATSTQTEGNVAVAAERNEDGTIYLTEAQIRKFIKKGVLKKEPEKITEAMIFFDKRVKRGSMIQVAPGFYVTHPESEVELEEKMKENGISRRGEFLSRQERRSVERLVDKKIEQMKKEQQPQYQQQFQKKKRGQ